MGLRLAACAILLLGCIEPSLEPCGQLACPGGTTCVAAMCVTADQLSACTDRADDDGCTLSSGTVGRCHQGICTPVGCGNGVLDPDEVCDDGNVSAEDGCSGTCDSDEMCGNGVLDVVTGESCDCGRDEAARPEQCVAPNSDDPSSACTTTCRLRRCGDGEVSGPEQCDGAVSDAAACSDFGYYRGTLTCSSLCQLDPASCDGRCGDGIVDVGPEVCDTTPPSDLACTQYGFDLGPLGCAASCTPDLSDCDRLAWSRAEPSTEQAIQVSAADGRLVILFAGGRATAVDVDGTSVDAPSPFDYSAVASSANGLYAVGPGRAFMFTNGAWSALPTVPWGAAVAPYAAWASAADGLFVAVDGASKVDRLQTTWTAIALPGPIAKPRFGGSATTMYVFPTDGATLFRFNASTFDPVALNPSPAKIADIATVDSGGLGIKLYVATGTDLIEYGTSNVKPLGFPAARLSATSNRTVDALLQVGTQSSLLRIGLDGFGPVVAPNDTRWITSDNGVPYVAGANSGVFTLRKGVITFQAALPAGVLFEHLRPVSSGGLWVSGEALYKLAPKQLATLEFSLANMSDGLVGGGAGDFGYATIDTGSLSVTSSGTTLQYLLAISPRTLDRFGSSVFVAGVGDEVVEYQHASQKVVSHALPQMLTLAAIAGTSPSDLYAVGSSSISTGVVVHFDGNTWTIDSTTPPLPPLQDVYVTQTGGLVQVWAVGNDRIFHYVAQAGWTEYMVAGASLIAVDGVNDDDVWFVGDADFGVAFEGVAHWDGAHLYPVRTGYTGNVRDVVVMEGTVSLLHHDIDGNSDVITINRVGTW